MFRAAVGAAVCIVTLAGPVSAQAASDVFYNDPDATLKQEIAAYVAMIDQLKTTGQPATVAGTFSFTNAAANSPLFDPYPAMRRTVNATLGNGFCWAVPNGTVVNYASTSTIASPLSDTPATINHFNAIVDASQTGDVTFGFTGNDLVSQGIPIQPVSGTPTPATPYVADAATMQWIGGIESHAVGVAATFVDADDVTNRLTGALRDVHHLANSVYTRSVSVWGEEPNDIRFLEVNFGLFGSLPILAVWFDDGYFLMDGTNGIVSGPFLDGVAYDPTELLLLHSEFTPGTGSRVIDAISGCEDNGLAKRWKEGPSPYPYPVPGTNPNQRVPVTPPAQPPNGFPRINFPIDSFPARPGRQTDFHCQTTGAACRCSSYRQTLTPGGQIIWEVETCASAGDCNSPTHTPPGQGNCNTYHYN